MRILHVSDLHLGRALGELSREAEQRAMVNEIVQTADGLDTSLTLISGDVFDAFTPPAWAEELFFELIDGPSAATTGAAGGCTSRLWRRMSCGSRCPGPTRRSCSASSPSSPRPGSRARATAPS